jgi:serine/threonine protein kinase
MQTIQQLGRYEILAELGRGAMGAVFRARDPRIERTVAIKTISAEAASGKSADEYRTRFFHEAQAAGRLSHAGIVTIFDVEEDEATRTPFIVMEFVNGRTLDEYIAAAPEGKLARDAALDVIRQIAEALQYAHSAGIVHRDVKPGNILVTSEGRIKIADFGIARMALKDASVSGHVAGTPAYMSPEQINGGPVDGRSDVFSLGVIAYWLLTGIKPFDGDTITEICAQVAGRAPKAASQVAAGLDGNYDHVLARALAKEPNARYQCAMDLAEDIDDLRHGRKPRSLNGSQIKECTVVLPAVSASDFRWNQMSPADQQRGKPTRGQWAAWSLLAAACVLLALAGAFIVSYSRTMPATLQVVGKYPFHNGEIYIWVDGDLRYHDERHSTHAQAHSSNGALALTLPVRAGRHMIRVQVDGPGQIYDHDTAIPGLFRAFSEKTLLIDFRNRNLDLHWE